MSLETMSKRTRVWGTGGDLRHLVGTKLFQDISNYIMESSIAQGHIFAAIAFIYATYAVEGFGGASPPQDLFISGARCRLCRQRAPERMILGGLAALQTSLHH
jgi:hypothetical protein